MDWCGYYVIPAAIEMRVFVEASPLVGATVQVRSFRPFQTHASFNLNDIAIDSTSDLRYVGSVLKAMLLESSIPTDRAFSLRFVESKDVRDDPKIVDLNEYFDDLPVKKGLSSSAALCVAVATAVSLVNRLSSPSPSSYLPSSLLAKSLADTIMSNLTRFANLAYVGERKILGVNCGQMDQYASAYGGILFIDCRSEPPGVNKINVETSIHLVIGDTQQPKDTARILAWLGERFKKRESKFIDGVKGITEVVLQARKELQRREPSLERIGELMNLNQVYLSKNLNVSGDCPISPSHLDKLISASLDEGALGAKVSGSGGGGCMVALCDNEEKIRAVAKSIERVGGRAYPTRIAKKGLRLELLEI
jgi:galactokinase